MHILRTQCIQKLTYGAGVWKCKNEHLCKLVVSFNSAVRKVFSYKRFESVKGILRDFCTLPLDFYIDRMRLLLLYDCLKSKRSVVRMCAEVSADGEDVVRSRNELILL